MKTLTVVSPVFNEEQVIRDFYIELKRVLTTVADSYRSTILFVVDPGPDHTVEVLKEIAAADPSVGVIVLSRRFGHQMSLLAGIDHCDSDVVIMLDSDLQHPPSFIPVLLAEHAKGFDVVYTVREDTADVSFVKRTCSKLFYRLINLISEVPINESAADFRLLSRRVIRVFQTEIRERKLFLRGLVGWVGFPSVAVPFQVGARPTGTSKYSFRRMVRFGVDGVVSFSRRPLQAAGLLGLAIGAFGLLHGVITLVQYFVYESLPSGWTTLTILISIFSGVQLAFLGILGEYLAAVYDEVKGRPHYLVDESVNVATREPLRT